MQCHQPPDRIDRTKGKHYLHPRHEGEKQSPRPIEVDGTSNVILMEFNLEDASELELGVDLAP